MNLADLRRGVAFRIHSDDLDSFCLGLTLDRLLDLIKKIRLEVGDGQADGYWLFLRKGWGREAGVGPKYRYCGGNESKFREAIFDHGFY